MSLTLAAVFSDGMVLQRDKPIPIWGTAEPRATVTISWRTTTLSCLADETGRWMLMLPATGAGGPYELTVTCSEEKLYRGCVYVGEVWLAGGQSNMELPLRDSERGADAVRESKNPYLHFYAPARVTTVKEAEQLEQSADAPAWKKYCACTSGEFSAVAYYAGQTLSEHLPGIHIGILQCCWGGTYANCWLPISELQAFSEGRRQLAAYEARCLSDEDYDRAWNDYMKSVDAYNATVEARRRAEPTVTWQTLHADYGEPPWPPPAGRTAYQHPGNLYDAMLSRLMPYALRGFWWYQGEQDEEFCEDYHALLTRLICRWRQDWNDERLPFLLCQLPMYISVEAETDPMRWPVLRKAQADTAQELQNVEMAVLADCGEFDNIHPIDKKTPGERLGLLALETMYGQSVVGRSPTCVDARRDGDAVLLRFTHTGGGLRLTDGGFQLAGADDAFHEAEAEILTLDTVRVSGVPEPKTVRYAWYSYGSAGLHGGTGLAAAPFEITL